MGRRFLALAVMAVWALAVVADKDEPNSRDKRQRLRRSGHPPPYAVQMEPIAHYSQRDPLYNPLQADAKSDDQAGYYEDSPYNYYPTEPEPIIEIIIKESNESLPTPAPVAPPAAPKKKEPIQVFYVKYEKKQEYGEEKPRVVYDTPVPALVPVEEHEEIRPEEAGPPEPAYPEPAQPPEPSTTLRTVIRPDSEQYHSSSGIRVTFGTEHLPPNSHNKRSDKDAPDELAPTALPPPGSPKRPHGPLRPRARRPAEARAPGLRPAAHRQLVRPPAAAPRRPGLPAAGPAAQLRPAAAVPPAAPAAAALPATLAAGPHQEPVPAAAAAAAAEAAHHHPGPARAAAAPAVQPVRPAPEAAARLPAELRAPAAAPQPAAPGQLQLRAAERAFQAAAGETAAPQPAAPAQLQLRPVQAASRSGEAALRRAAAQAAGAEAPPGAAEAAGPVQADRTAETKA